MKKKIVSVLCTAALVCTMFAGCGGDSAASSESDSAAPAATEEAAQVEEESEDASEDTTDDAEAEDTSEAAASSTELADGVYSAEFDTDSGMFHVNEANDDKGVLTVENGQMTIHVSLVSKNIVNLFVGTAEDAQKEGAEILEPTTDTVTYSDGISGEVYGFDIPVPALDEEFDVAIIGNKDKWYDHKVSVTNPEPQ